MLLVHSLPPLLYALGQGERVVSRKEPLSYPHSNHYIMIFSVGKGNYIAKKKSEFFFGIMR
jgi:hypothetical protein